MVSIPDRRRPVFFIGRAAQFRTDSIAALTLVGGLGNTSFIGIPMVEALHGHDGVPLAVIIDQVGTYLVLSTLGTLAVALYTSTGTSALVMARKVLTFPPFIAVCFAFLMMEVDYPAWLRQLLQRLSDTVAPLAVLSVGCQMRFAGIRNHLKPLSIGLLYKLVICPSLVLITYLFVHPASNGAGESCDLARVCNGTADRGRNCRHAE